MMNKTKMLLEKIDEEFLPYEDQVKIRLIFKFSYFLKLQYRLFQL